jgi:hypothetical protein
MLLFLILFLLLPQPVFAQTANSLTVAPSIIRLDLATDKPEALLEYKNTTNKTIELSLSASDFAELEHGYKPSFLDEKTAQNYKYSLSSWIDFDKKTLVIAPFATESVTVFINKDKLSPGGHYGSILARITNTTDSETVQIQGVLSSLIFVRTNTGQEKELGEIQNFAPNRTLIAFPKTFALRFKNTGDTDLIPYGLVEIKDMFGRTVAKGILNEGSLATLPESIRSYDIEVKANTFLFPGMYSADFKGHFGKTNQQMQAEKKFFSEGNLPIIPIGFVAAIIILYIKKRKAKKA